MMMVAYVPNPEYSFRLYSAPVAKLGTTWLRIARALAVQTGLGHRLEH